MICCRLPSLVTLARALARALALAIARALAVHVDGRTDEERLREQHKRYHWGNQGTHGAVHTIPATPHHHTYTHHPPTPHQPHTKQGECVAIALAVPLAVALAVAVLNLC